MCNYNVNKMYNIDDELSEGYIYPGETTIDNSGLEIEY